MTSTAPQTVTLSLEELRHLAMAINWAAHFGQYTDATPRGPAARDIREATAVLNRNGVYCMHSIHSRAWLGIEFEALATGEVA